MRDHGNAINVIGEECFPFQSQEKSFLRWVPKGKGERILFSSGCLLRPCTCLSAPVQCRQRDLERDGRAKKEGAE